MEARISVLCSGRVLSFALSLTFAFVASHGAVAATFDVAGGDTAGLINALEAANATPEADTVNLGAGSFVLTSAHNNASGPNGLPSITTDITLNGASRAADGGITSVIERDAAGDAFRLLHVAATGVLRMNRVELRGGSVAEIFEDFSPACFDPCGGGLLVEQNGQATLSDSRLTDNHGGETGGAGAYNLGRLIVSNSTITGGQTLTSGGAFTNTSTGTLNIINSLITGNRADESAGAISNGGTLFLSNSTLSDNGTSDGRPTGGGLRNFGDATLNFVTIYDNFGGGVVATSPVIVRNSVLAGNNDDSGSPLDCDGTLESQGYNLIGVADTCSIDDTAATGPDQTGSTAAPLDPGLGPLQDNSGNNGVTWTHAPLPGSPLIDAATPREPLFRAFLRTTDQRGFVRITGVNDDVGAHEFEAPPGCYVSNLAALEDAPFDLLLLLFLGGPRPATIVGGPGDDTLEGTPGADVIVGLGGNDDIRGRFGNDLVCAGPGDDLVIGNGGNDDLYGDDGDDTIFAGGGDDELLGGAGDDVCNGGAHLMGDVQSGCEVVSRIP